MPATAAICAAIRSCENIEQDVAHVEIDERAAVSGHWSVYFDNSLIRMFLYDASAGSPPWICRPMIPLRASVSSGSV